MSKVRKLTGWIAIVAMLFAQLAVAAYACKIGSPQPPASGEAVPACHQVDIELANLCQKHCHDAEQPQSAAPLPPAFAAAFIVHIEPSARAASMNRIRPLSLLHHPPPPLTIRNCCFRI